MTTASEILDEMDPRERIDSLAAAYMAFTVCPECGHVDDGVKILINHPCQPCGTKIETRQILFDGEQRFLEMIFDCYRSANSKELSVLLFCALIEHQLRQLIISRCLRFGVPWLLIDLLLEKYWRVDERLKLFERLTGTSVKAALSDTSGKKIFEAYSNLRQKRDGLAHGLPAEPYVIKSQDIRLAVDEAANSFSAFAHLHHAYCAADSPPMPER